MIGDRWEVTDSEILRCYPCGDFVISPALRTVTSHGSGWSALSAARSAWPSGSRLVRGVRRPAADAHRSALARSGP
jgi:hypothetical protein